MDFWAYGKLSLFENETYSMKSTGVKIASQDNTSKLEGDLILTSHRFIFEPWRGGPDIYDCVWIPFYVITEFPKSAANWSGNFFSSKKYRFLIDKKSIPSHAKVNGPFSNFDSIAAQNCDFYISFKDKYCASFMKAAEEFWNIRKSDKYPSLPLVYKDALQKFGIAGIENNLKEQHQEVSNTISNAFQDLDKLMQMASEMVTLSQFITKKLTDARGSFTDDETVLMKSYLLSLGISDPVTRETYADDNDFFHNIAKEISSILTDVVTAEGGMLSITNAYCRVNRARGMQLLSSDDFIFGCAYLKKLKLPIVMVEYQSGVKVIQLASISDDSICDKVKSVLKSRKSVSASELALLSHMPVTLAHESLLVAEKCGIVCRDDTIEGLKFYYNKFLRSG